jgi:putative transcriptional regulator
MLYILLVIGTLPSTLVTHMQPMTLPSTFNLKNHFLIAMPNLEDPHFTQSVTYIIEHSQEGSMGLVCNRPAPFTIKNFFDHLKIQHYHSSQFEAPVYFGGPVQPEKGFILHNGSAYWRSSIQISDQVCLTTSDDILFAIAENQGPTQFLIMLGYAGWSENQLEHEMIENAWLSVSAEATLLFETSHEQKWQKAAKLMGIDIHLMSRMAGHA